MLPLFDEPPALEASEPEPAGELEAAILKAEALRPAAGWPYLLALREVNGWASGYYPEGAQ